MCITLGIYENGVSPPRSVNVLGSLDQLINDGLQTTQGKRAN